MIKLVLLDLGETLIRKGQPLPGAVAALEALAKLRTTADKPLVLALVSDYYPPDPPGDEAAVRAKETDYRAVLAAVGLGRFFEPFAERVTLSTRAGVAKPARKVFELAAARSGTGATLGECLFVTEEAAHLAKAREYGLTVVRFGTGPGLEPAFGDWAAGPPLLARLVAGKP